MKKFLIIFCLFPLLCTAQNAHLVIDGGGILVNDSQLIVDGDVYSTGQLKNNNYMENSGDIHLENYDGLGIIALSGFLSQIMIEDTVHHLILNDGSGFFTLENHLYVRDELEWIAGNINAVGFILHLNNENYAQNLSGNIEDVILYNGLIRQNLSATGIYHFPVGAFGQNNHLSIEMTNTNPSGESIDVGFYAFEHPNLPSSDDYQQGFWDVSTTINDPNVIYEITGNYTESSIQGDESNLVPNVFYSNQWTGPSPGADTEQGTFVLDTLNNQFTLSAIQVLGDVTTFSWYLGCNGDANYDGIVNILDLVAVSSNFGCSNDNCEGDANDDGVVNILDLLAVSSNFGILCGS